MSTYLMNQRCDLQVNEDITVVEVHDNGYVKLGDTARGFVELTCCGRGVREYFARNLGKKLAMNLQFKATE